MQRHAIQSVYLAARLASFSALAAISLYAQTSDSEWKPVEDALGRSGQAQPGEVMKFSMPRKDLHVSLNGVEIKPGLALGSWVAFKRHGTETMVMGDLVLTLDEVEPV